MVIIIIIIFSVIYLCFPFVSPFIYLFLLSLILHVFLSSRSFRILFLFFYFSFLFFCPPFYFFMCLCLSLTCLHLLFYFSLSSCLSPTNGNMTCVNGYVSFFISHYFLLLLHSFYLTKKCGRINTSFDSYTGCLSCNYRSINWLF
jgi:hypothetical protein